jgi:hypothetical protein
VLGELVAPGRELARRLTDHPPADGDHELGAFGEGQELQGPEEPQHRVIPAQEGLEAGEAAVIEGDDRLVVEDQLLVTERGPELGSRIARRRQRHLATLSCHPGPSHRLCRHCCRHGGPRC